jgi:hypothetical protein
MNKVAHTQEGNVIPLAPKGAYAYVARGRRMTRCVHFMTWARFSPPKNKKQKKTSSGGVLFDRPRLRV